MFKLISLLALVISIASQPVRSPEIWATPIPDFEKRHFSNFVNPASKWGAGHRGIDLQVSRGEKVFSPFDGVVSFSGKVVNRNLITLKSKTGLLASFEPLCTELAEGDQVTQGSLIGSYCSGDADYKSHCELCLHFSVRSEHVYLNPLLFVASIKPSVIIS